MTNEKKKNVVATMATVPNLTATVNLCALFIYKDIHINHSIQISNPFPPLSLSQSQSDSFTLKTNDDVTLSYSQNQRRCCTLSLWANSFAFTADGCHFWHIVAVADEVRYPVLMRLQGMVLSHLGNGIHKMQLEVRQSQEEYLCLRL